MSSHTTRVVALAAIGLLSWASGDASPARASEPADDGREQAREVEADERPPVEWTEHVEVRARVDDLTGIADSATEGVTGREDLDRRPRLRSGELVETVPGVIATQHSGGGKANQYFLRGFNLDHGTDFRIGVEGMQVNLPTHGHGQGYADLNFLIPELIDTAHFRKGPYYADGGDFSAAGSVEFDLLRSLADPRLQLDGGSDGYARALAAGSLPWQGGDLLGAVEYSHYDGPWERPDDFEKVNALVRWGRTSERADLALTFMGYEGTWDATDQIPRRAVEQGLIGRFGLLDPDLGGESGRYSLSGAWARRADGVETRVHGFVQSYDLELLSNFTYFLDDPLDGDEFLQLDDRTVVGAGFAQSRRVAGPRERLWRWGADLRFDAVDNGLYGASGGVRDEVVREDTIDQLGGGVFVEAEVRWLEWLRTRAGLRGDVYDVDVDSDLAANSGSDDDALVSPKLSVVLGPWARTEVYVNLGYGHHSNDARGATIRVDPRTGDPVDRVEPLVRARGADVGFRTTALRGLQSSVSFFVLELDSELVFVGDAGGTEASRPSRRRGVELANYWRPRPWLSLDLDAALTDAAFTDHDPAGDDIPGAIERALAAGVSVHDLGPWSGSLRWRYFGPRPLIEDDSVRSGSTSLVNLRVGYAFRRGPRLALEVFNLLDRADDDIAYFYASRLPGEPAEGIEDVHFHPMESRTVRLVLEWR